MALADRFLGAPARPAVDGEGDRALVARSRAGDTHAFEELYRRYLPMVAAVVRRNAPSEAVEDCVQATFLRAFQRLDQLRDGVAFAAWLGRVAVNTCRDEHDRESTRSRFRTGDGEAALARVVDDRNDPFLRAADLGLRPELVAGVEGVSDDRRRLLYLRYVAGHSIGEIARRLAASPRSLSLELSAAKTQARSRIARRAVPDGAPLGCVRRAAALADWLRAPAERRDAETTLHVESCAHCGATIRNLRGLLDRHALLPLGLLGGGRALSLVRRASHAVTPAMVAGAGVAAVVALSPATPVAPSTPSRPATPLLLAPVAPPLVAAAAADAPAAADAGATAVDGDPATGGRAGAEGRRASRTSPPLLITIPASAPPVPAPALPPVAPVGGVSVPTPTGVPLPPVP